MRHKILDLGFFGPLPNWFWRCVKVSLDGSFQVVIQWLGVSDNNCPIDTHPGMIKINRCGIVIVFYVHCRHPIRHVPAWRFVKVWDGQNRVRPRYRRQNV